MIWFIVDYLKKNPSCPKCKSSNTALIIYGDGWSDLSLYDRKVFFSGCIIHPGDPKWKCLKCKHSFGLVGLKNHDLATYEETKYNINKTFTRRYARLSKQKEDGEKPIPNFDSESGKEFLDMVLDLFSDKTTEPSSKRKSKSAKRQGG